MSSDIIDNEIIQSSTLLPTPFSECSIVWNDKKQSFIPNDYVDVIKCCTSKCDYIKSKCDSFCKTLPEENRTDCNFKCNEQLTYCTDNCFVQDIKSVNGSNPFNYCTKKYNCTDRECLLQKKNDLIQCCRHNCIPTKYVDCDKLCNYSFDLAYGKNGEKDYDIIEQYCFPCKSLKSYKDFINLDNSIYLVFLLWLFFSITLLIMKINN